MRDDFVLVRLPEHTFPIPLTLAYVCSRLHLEHVRILSEELSNGVFEVVPAMPRVHAEQP